MILDQSGNDQVQSLLDYVSSLVGAGVLELEENEAIVVVLAYKIVVQGWREGVEGD